MSIMTVARLIIVLAVSLFAAVTASSQALAQGDALRFFQSNPSRSIFRTTPDVKPPSARRAIIRQREAEPAERSSSASRRQAPAASATVALPDRPAVSITTFVHVIGDSLSELLAQGLKEQLADTKPEIGVSKRTRSSSGIVRDDYHDWNKSLRELLGGTEKVDLVIMMLGSNDRQPLRDDLGSHDFRSDRWRELYAKRVDDLIALTREKRLPFVIVGMPVMQGQRLSADMLYINDIMRERATRGGASYVDIWEGFASEQGQYASSGPDVNGEIVKLRTADGVHFTKAGARKLGFFASKEVDLRLSREKPGVEIAALPSDLSEQIKRDSPGLTPQGLQAALPLPEDLPLLPVIRERPLAGPIVALTSPPQTPGGQILAKAPPVSGSEITILVEQALGHGRLPPPKPGRVDDLPWPRQPALNARAN